ncbi:DNA polymerase-3 subunit alpha [Ereboglobus sp. PH5-10]|uniref:DNA polymerase III subunit alpha n=1 Tax=Ereboglobus sp. PH5-10 TaxID=2940629 RepID=UPI0024059F4F|nr:DNA polymerase III subunit alpha [Ereboglobus sp. PH5-10]MDF9826702.1 DNA polymerase-3 subunit alpha [Ereboglobus sp. PH5-10]
MSAPIVTNVTPSAPAKDFVHLHVHSDRSLLDGCCQVDKLCKHAASLGMTALALTDHGNLFGAIDFYNAAKKQNLKPIIGCEIYLVEGSRLEKQGRAEDGKSYYHLGLLAKNLTGYQNLLKLVSDAHLHGFYYKPRADWETLAKYSEGLIAFSGCLAAIIPQHLMHDREREARAACARFVEIFGRENFVIEIQDHGIPEQIKIIPGLLKLGEEFGLRVIASNDVHYIRDTDADPHDAMLCIQTGAKLDEPNRMRFDTKEFYLKSHDEMARLFAEVPESITNTRAIAEMCDLEIPFPKGSERYPKYPLPVEIKSVYSPSEYLHKLCVDGLKQRYGVDHDEVAARPAVAERLEKLATALVAGQKAVEERGITIDKLAPDEKPQPPDNNGLAPEEILVVRTAYELAIINLTTYVDYFLVVWDFIRWAKEHDIPVGPGRGSGAGSLVAYLLSITNIDPIRFGLLFERFLNPERVSAPDFDIDFCMRRRGEVIDYVREKYGRDCVANIITYGTMGAKMAIRDIARVNSLPFADSDRIAKMIPDELNISLTDSIKKSAELRLEIDRNPGTKRIIDTALVVEGMVRNTGKHAAGIIITDKPLDEFVPLTLQEGDVTVQYDMSAVGKLGLLKMDFLGLKTLTIISDAVENIRRTAAPDFDIEKIPLDDPVTYKLLNAGKTVGVFQLESEGMQNAARQVGISSIDDINAISALYRPGPMQFIPTYAAGKKNPASIVYPHPLLEPVLKETFGVIVYQEQVMECARVIAGFTLGGADMLRRAMGKKDEAEMNRQRGIFVEGAKKTLNLDAKKANEIFDLLHKFAQYGFNKSHSAAYAMIAYQTAYMKANYPVQFMAAVLTAELGNAEKVSHFIAEAEAMGITVLGPDINESGPNFTPVIARPARSGGTGDSPVGSGGMGDSPMPSGKIRFGLAGIKGVGEQAAVKSRDERDAHGPYTSFENYILRSDPRAINKRVLENLVATGAFDFSGVERETLFPRIDLALGALSELQRKYPALKKDAGKPKEEAPAGTMLFDLGAIDSAPPLPPMGELEKEFAQILKHSRKVTPAAPAAAIDDDNDTLALGAVAKGKKKTASTGAAERILTKENRLQFEKELLGFYVSGHPLNEYAGLVEALDTYAIGDLITLPDRTEFRLCGICGNIAKRLSKKDNRPWASFGLSNKNGAITLNMFASTYEEYGAALAENALVAVQGMVQVNKEGEKRIQINECYPLVPFIAQNIRRITWLLKPDHPELPEFLKALRKTLDQTPGKTETSFAFLFEDRVAPIAEAADSLAWTFTTECFNQIRNHPAVLGAQIHAGPLILKRQERRWAPKRD